MKKLAKKFVFVSVIYYITLLLLLLSFTIVNHYFVYSFTEFFIISISYIILACIVTFIRLKVCLKINLFAVFQSQLNPNELLGIEKIWFFSYYSLIYKAHGKLSVGEYKDAVDICNREIKYNKNKNTKYEFLSILSFAYFQLDDIELLKDTCDKIDSLVKDNPRLAAKFSNTLITFYRFYIEGQYDKCFESCQNRLAEIEGKPEEYNLARLNNYFFIAVSYFKNKDAENAKKWFEEVIRFGPKMYVSEIAKQYLAKIATDDLSAIELPKVIPEEHYTRSKVQIIRRIIMFAAVVLFSTCMVLLAINVFRPANDPRSEDIRSELDEIYDDYKLLGRCDALYDGEIVDTFALVLVEDRIDLATLVYYDYGNGSYTKEIKIRIIDMQADREYALTDIFNYSCITEFSLIDGDKADDEEYLEKIEFKKDGKDMAFVIEDVYPVN